MKNIIIGCLISAMMSITLGYFIGWKRANDTAALKEAAAALQHKTVGDSLRDVIIARQKELLALSKKSDSAVSRLKQQIKSSRLIIAEVRDSAKSDTTPEMRAISACSVVFSTCEQTVEQLQEELAQAKAQIASTQSKIRSDSTRYDNERRSWARREASLVAGRNYGTAIKTSIIMGAACYVSHMRK